MADNLKVKYDCLGIELDELAYVRSGRRLKPISQHLLRC